MLPPVDREPSVGPRLNFDDPRLPDRFWTKVIPEPNSGCWLWLGAAPAGYGQLRWPHGGSSRRVAAHRLATSVEGRDVPDDLTIDHRCETPCCVNPAHLDIVTREENTRRYWERHPHLRCPNGHVLAEVGAYFDRNGRFKNCKLCRREELRRKYVPHPRPFKTHCPKGHPRTPENLTTQDFCRLCDRARKKVQYARKIHPAVVRTGRKAFCLNGHARSTENIDTQGACRLCRKERRQTRHLGLAS